MPSQFNAAKRALLLKNTTHFNTNYGITGERSRMVKAPSQFELAKLALRANSPVSFNELYGYSSSPNSSPRFKGGKRTKTRKAKRSLRKTRRVLKK